MYRSRVERDLRAEQERDGFLFPAYDSYCFGNIPGTVGSLLGVDAGRALPSDVFYGVETDVSRVVLVVVDGYGLDSWTRDCGDHEFLAHLRDRGTVTPLTTIYPSETAAAITTVETGQLTAEHGRIGWDVYDPETDRSFLSLDGRVKVGPGDTDRAPEASAGVSYHYGRLADAGVDCHRLQSFTSTYGRVTQHTYDEVGMLGESLASVVGATSAPGYVYAHLPEVDAISHAEGTESAAFQETLATVCEQLSAFVGAVDEATASETLLLVTADHGHVNTDPERNVDLGDRDTVMANLRRHEDGTPVRLAGSPRNVHLHLEPGTVEETRAALSDLDARVFTREEALDSSLFGDGPVSEQFRRRCGDLVLTHRSLGTWFGDTEAEELDLVGMHGGLNPAEMLVPFAAARLDSLQ